MFNVPIIPGAYKLFFLTAVLFTMFGCFLFAVKRGFDWRKIVVLLTLMFVAALLGARVLNMFTNWPSYADNPEIFFALNLQSFSLYGGIFFAMLAGWMACQLLKINPWKLGDTFIPFLGISVAIMRIGCFFNGCCFGRETDLFWAVKYPRLSPIHLQQMANYGNYFEVDTVHPTQIYEFFAALMFSALAFWMLKRKCSEGLTIVVFILGFSVFRLGNSYLRVNSQNFAASAYFYPILYLFIIGASALLIRKKIGVYSSSIIK